MNYHNIDKCNLINGEGLRVVIWLSGCSHKCVGCFNPETHDPNSGILFDNQAEDELFQDLKQDYIDGITLCGGSPLYEGNRSEVYRLVKRIRKELPNKTIWLYTGYTWEQIQNIPTAKQIVDLIDVLIDGRFIESLKDPKLHWKGSSNQRVIDVQKTLDKNEIVLYD